MYLYDSILVEALVIVGREYSILFPLVVLFHCIAKVLPGPWVQQRG